MITARQTRAARALLGWSQETLADKALVSLTALKRLESQNDLKVHEATRDQIRLVIRNSNRFKDFLPRSFTYFSGAAYDVRYCAR